MLNQLFGSNTRVKLLHIFLSNPEEKYYIRQLGRDLGLQVNSVRRELQNLEKIGLLVIRANDNAPKETVPKTNGEANRPLLDKKYYQVNKNFVLFNELHDLFVKSQLLVAQAFTTDLKAASEPKLIVLSGFFVEDQFSKTDLLIVGTIKREILEDAVAKLERGLGREVRYTVMSEEEFHYRQNISDSFIFNLFKSKHLLLLSELSA
jgi:hypothetical protein